MKKIAPKLSALSELFTHLDWDPLVVIRLLLILFIYFWLWLSCLNAFKAVPSLAYYNFNNVPYMFVYIILE